MLEDKQLLGNCTVEGSRVGALKEILHKFQYLFTLKETLCSCFLEKSLFFLKTFTAHISLVHEDFQQTVCLSSRILASVVQ